MSATPRAKRRNPELFLNRELAWLAFNDRIIEEASDASVPLLERLKFAIVAAGNLDEFFMVRVARLKQAQAEGDTAPDASGLTPGQQLSAISAHVHRMVERLHAVLAEEILVALAPRGIQFPSLESLPTESRAQLARHFRAEVLPALTPMGIDASRPLPMLAGLGLNLAVLLDPAAGETEARLAVVPVPGGLSRLVRPAGMEGNAYLRLEEIIRSELEALFPGQAIRESAVFRVTRDSELWLDEERRTDRLLAVEEELRRRRRSRVVRLEMEDRVSETMAALLAVRLEAAEEEIYRISGPLDIRALQPLLDLPSLEDLRDPPLRPLPLPGLSEGDDLFAILDERDLLLHHPYDSFDPVVEFLARAAGDPGVLAIKQTLYRSGGADSPVVKALARAAEAGKQVTVLVELMARFDEQRNIQWARRLEEAGAHVIYGIRGYKTHSKICLVVRRGRQGIRRYVHLGTGNYNDRTARGYADFGLLTANEEIGRDASAFFNALTGYSDPPRMKRLVMAPSGLRERFLDLIGRETRRAESGQTARIQAKMNSLVDEEIIRALYDAARAGVTIRLNVRGICCLKPGVKGLSESISVVSVVDRFLEHARVFHFLNGGDEEVYLSSADWMSRNLDRRVELLFPVDSPENRARVLGALDAMFLDNVKSSRLQADGSYRRNRPGRGDEPYRAQMQLYREAQRALERARAAAPTLEPIRTPEEA